MAIMYRGKLEPARKKRVGKIKKAKYIANPNPVTLPPELKAQLVDTFPTPTPEEIEVYRVRGMLLGGEYEPHGHYMCERDTTGRIVKYYDPDTMEPIYGTALQLRVLAWWEQDRLRTK